MNVEIDEIAQEINAKFMNKMIEVYLEEKKKVHQELHDRECKMNLESFLFFNFAPIALLAAQEVNTLCEHVIFQFREQGKERIPTKKELTHDFAHDIGAYITQKVVERIEHADKMKAQQPTH